MRAKEFSSKNLVIFDIDDTLVHSHAQINVINKSTGQVVRTLNSQEFSHYKRSPSEELDFGEFRNAEMFNSKSQPINSMIVQLNQDIDTGNKVALVTARENIDDMELFKNTFKKWGVHIDRAELILAGEMPAKTIPQKKVMVIESLLTGIPIGEEIPEGTASQYRKVIMYDDSRSNLIAFVNMVEKYPNTKFFAWWVNPNTGATQEIVRSHPPANHSLNESHSLKEKKKNFLEMFEKFLPLAMHYLKLDSLPTMVFEPYVDSPDQPTFGMFVNDENTLYVALLNRHPVDILRTIAHELAHYKQNTEHKLGPNSGKTGSPQENQAHQLAGIIMRHFNKLYPKFLDSEPIIE